MLLIATVAVTSDLQAQQQQLFDAGWQFTRNGKTINVDLPHDWDIYTAPDPKTGATGTGGGWYPGGKGEYRKTFKTPKGELTKLHFEGVYQKAEVYVNGQKAGQHAYGYTPFTVDLTPYLYIGAKQDNEVLVKVDNSEQPNCRWYSGSGIYRHIWLETMQTLHLAENGVRVWTPEVSDKQARVDMNVWIENEGENTRQIDDVEVTFRGGTFSFIDERPQLMYSPSVSFSKRAKRLPVALKMLPTDQPQEPKKIENVPLKPGHVATYVLSYTIDQPRLWSPDDPYLYEAVVRLKSEGRVIGEQRVKFGIRTFSFSAGRGFVLNGQPILLNGACVHHDDGVLGAMAFDAAEIRKVRQMKDAGFNLIRTSHNPTTRAFLDACDSIGMLVIDEAFDGWRQSKTTYDYSTLIDSCYREDIQAMVGRDINHPSIICWSIGNEVMERKDIRVITTARQLKQAILEMDNTRPVTEALCSWDSDWEIYDPHAEVLDVVGYNYMIHKHKGDHQRDKKRIMWQTESYPRDAFKNWQLVRDHPYIVGDIVWTGLDYLGESGIGRNYYEGERPGEHYVSGGQPDWHGAYCGDVDITGYRKPISIYREMLWSTSSSLSQEGDVYLAVREPDGYHGKIYQTAWSVWPTWNSWNWLGSRDPKGATVSSWEGKPIDVEVYTKAKEVKLFLNDKLIDTKAVSEATEYKAVFTLPYQPGILRAEASGRATVLRTAGEPARLRLTPDRRVITADGQDLSFVTVEVVDKDGWVCPDAAIPCEAIVKGQGSLLSFASAALKDREPYTSSHVTTWKGRALLVVRSTEKKGDAQIRIKSTLPTATLNIKSKARGNAVPHK
jgi:beta-galactosidase